MTMADEAPGARAARDTNALRAGEAAAAGLKEALARVGVVVPSLRAGFPVQGNGRVELGGCNAGTATRLAEVLNTAADEVPELRAVR
ncbi:MULTISPECIES: hypothetical protein [unclassified Streptomyces]|uniref:hypothetical protein n=1 Tax=unclassified Streptomyces TaxID=2593676 RepID=UPI0037FD8782